VQHQIAAEDECADMLACAALRQDATGSFANALF
jgi:hypothetical protein